MHQSHLLLKCNYLMADAHTVIREYIATQLPSCELAKKKKKKNFHPVILINNDLLNNFLHQHPIQPNDFLTQRLLG